MGHCFSTGFYTRSTERSTQQFTYFFLINAKGFETHWKNDETNFHYEGVVVGQGLQIISMYAMEVIGMIFGYICLVRSSFIVKER